MTEIWLPTLKTADHQVGYTLVVKLSRVGMKVTQPSEDIGTQLPAAYEKDAGQLIASQVIAVNLQTVAAANNCWRSFADLRKRFRPFAWLATHPARYYEVGKHDFEWQRQSTPRRTRKTTRDYNI